MSAALAAPEPYASENDAFEHGENHPDEGARPALFARRVEAPVAAARYHLYLSWASIRSHHVAILRSLLDLEGDVSLSYVDSLRDARGWAFRSRTGADPVNGFTLLRQAYELSAPGFGGEVRVPLLWDRHRAAITSDDASLIVIDLLDGFGAGASELLATGPRVEEEVQRLERAFVSDLDAVLALRDPTRRTSFRHALADLDRRLAGRRYLVGDEVSDADIRLWVRLARLDAGPNASGLIGPRLDRYPNLWRWATALYELPAFSASTDFRRFAAPFADLPPWDLSGHANPECLP